MEPSRMTLYRFEKHDLVQSLVHSNYLILSLFYNVSYFSIFHIYIDVNESKHIYLSRFIDININMRNVRMTYILK